VISRVAETTRNGNRAAPVPVSAGPVQPLPSVIELAVVEGLGIFAFLFGHRLGAEGRLPTPEEITAAAIDGGISVGVDIFFQLYLPELNPYVDAALSSFLSGFLTGLTHRIWPHEGFSPGLTAGSLPYANFLKSATNSATDAFGSLP